MKVAIDAVFEAEKRPDGAGVKAYCPACGREWSVTHDVAKIVPAPAPSGG
tara:strand:- start:37138 stop:37287 length:150 start_codon:yes stop_codon:yes gene_type:complete